MQILIDRETRNAPHNDCRSDIEGISDLKLIDPRDREIVRELWQRLRYSGPLLDQLGWEIDDERDRFDVTFPARKTRGFLRRHLDGWGALLENSVTTEDELRRSLERATVPVVISNGEEWGCRETINVRSTYEAAAGLAEEFACNGGHGARWTVLRRAVGPWEFAERPPIARED